MADTHHQMTADLVPVSARRGPRPLDTLCAWQPSTTLATVAIVATSVAYGFAAFFARHLTDAGLDPAAVAFLRFALITAVLGHRVRFEPRHRRSTTWGLASGAAMAVGWIAYVTAVDNGDVATAGVVYLTYPLFTLLALVVVFGRRPSAGQVVGGSLVIVGATVAIGLGDGVALTAFAAPATFGLAIAVLTERLGPLDPVARLAAVSVGATVALTPAVLVLPRNAVVPPDLTTWVWAVGLGVGSALVPMLVYAAAAPVVGAARAAVAGSSELPTVFVIGAVFFGEAIDLRAVAGAAIIMAAIALTPATRSVHVSPDQDGA